MSKKEKTPKKIIDKIKESGKDFVEGVKEEIDVGKTSPSERARDLAARKKTELKSTITSRVSETSTPEDIYFSTWAWFWAMIFVVFICLSIFIFSLVNFRFIFVGLLALIAMPFLVIWCLIHMVPTIKIFGFTIFDRRRLSLRRQLTVGKEIARIFSREFLQESPIIAFLVFSFLIIFVFAVIIALI